MIMFLHNQKRINILTFGVHTLSLLRTLNSTHLFELYSKHTRDEIVKSKGKMSFCQIFLKIYLSYQYVYIYI